MKVTRTTKQMAAAVPSPRRRCLREDQVSERRWNFNYSCYKGWVFMKRIVTVTVTITHHNNIPHLNQLESSKYENKQSRQRHRMIFRTGLKSWNSLIGCHQMKNNFCLAMEMNEETVCRVGTNRLWDI